jgi:putative thioredoxin
LFELKEAERMEAIIGQGADQGDLIKDSDTENFAADVLDASNTTPVIVDFWAEWCGPCKTLGPMIEKVVRAAGGAVKLVKIDVDQNQQLAQQMRVQSIPAVFAFYKGQPVDGFAGALPESQIKDFVKRLTDKAGGSPIDDALAQAQEAFEAGDFTGASQVYTQVLQIDEENVQAIGGLAHCLIKDGEFEHAGMMLEGLDAKLKSKPEIASAVAALEMAAQSENAGDMGPLLARLEADENDHEARFELAQSLTAAGQQQEAVDQLLDIIERDRTWNEEAARTQLLTLFEAIGMTDPISKEGRRRLSAILFT